MLWSSIHECVVFINLFQIGPGYVQLNLETPMGSALLIQTVTPIEPMLQRVIHRLYAARTVLAPYCNLFLLGEAIMVSTETIFFIILA